MTYRLSPQAKSELEAIGDHIAEVSPTNAERFIERLTGKFVALGRNPRIGRARPELRSDLRSFPYGAYLIPIESSTTVWRSCASSMLPATWTISSDTVRVPAVDSFL